MLTSLQKALVDRAINTEINLLERLYPEGSPHRATFAQQIEELSVAREVIATTPDLRQRHAPSGNPKIAAAEAASGALYDFRYRHADKRSCCA